MREKRVASLVGGGHVGRRAGQSARRCRKDEMDRLHPRDDLETVLETVSETVSETKIDCSYEMGESVSSRDRLYLH